MPKSSNNKPMNVKGGFQLPPIPKTGPKGKTIETTIGGMPMTSTQSSPQALKEMMKVGTKVSTKTKEKIDIGVKFSPGVEFNVNQTFELQNGYDIPNYNGDPVSISSPKDGTYYDNPYVSQEEPNPNEAVNCRTAYNVCDVDPFAADTSAEEALQDVYNDLKIQINNSTGGGNTVTQTVFTFDNFKSYMQIAIEYYSILIELMSRQAWSPDEDYANLVLRNVAETCSTTDAITVRNKLSRVLSNMSLPVKLKSYITWWFQVYQANEGKSSKVQFNASTYFAGSVMESGDIDSYVGFINAKIDNDFTSNAAQQFVTIRSQITALLENRTDYNFETLRRVNIPCNTSQYDQSMKDIMVNTGIYDDVGGTATLYPPVLGSDETGPVCFEQTLDLVPVHSTEYLAARFGNNQPAVFKPSFYTSAVSSTVPNYSRYVAFSASGTNGFAVKAVTEDKPWRNLTDNAITLTYVNGFNEWIFIPRGRANIVYQLGLNSVRTAQRKFVYDLFGFIG